MKDKTFLMIPGPTPVPESVLLTMAKHPIGHRSTEFSALLARLYEDMKILFQTKNDVMVFTASGTVGGISANNSGEITSCYFYGAVSGEVAAAIALALQADAGSETEAAIATALHLYLSDAIHDVEPGIITLRRTPSAWDNKQSNFRKTPRK